MDIGNSSTLITVIGLSCMGASFILLYCLGIPASLSDLLKRIGKACVLLASFLFAIDFLLTLLNVPFRIAFGLVAGGFMGIGAGIFSYAYKLDRDSARRPPQGED